MQDIVDCNVGVITCPSSAIGMSAIRPMMTPNYNAILRILELAAAGVPIRTGSDNVADMCSPSTTANLMHEVIVLSSAIRFYHPQILGKLAAGATLTQDERDLIAEHLVKNDQEVAKVDKRWLGDAAGGFVSTG